MRQPACQYPVNIKPLCGNLVQLIDIFEIIHRQPMPCKAALTEMPTPYAAAPVAFRPRRAGVFPAAKLSRSVSAPCG